MNYNFAELMPIVMHKMMGIRSGKVSRKWFEKLYSTSCAPAHQPFRRSTQMNEILAGPHADSYRHKGGTKKYCA